MDFSGVRDITSSMLPESQVLEYANNHGGMESIEVVGSNAIFPDGYHFVMVNGKVIGLFREGIGDDHEHKLLTYRKRYCEIRLERMVSEFRRIQTRSLNEMDAGYSPPDDVEENLTRLQEQATELREQIEEIELTLNPPPPPLDPKLAAMIEASEQRRRDQRDRISALEI
ncbi:hypothetical protein [Calycomorphotria hydatis]|uniref:Uncharacterized protein n=1 Tax=Calycomorphotria hydatis TaxID=2528027 RepID=A0A517TDB5_9PLAN|nr:hypothetical protein [Calycomorphotria hydatis]QDT66368.1 hypothetical protein V22_36340 [Calycomorphotria hydatis]